MITEGELKNIELDSLIAYFINDMYISTNSEYCVDKTNNIYYVKMFIIIGYSTM